jgi:hypothetical protein
MAAVIREEEIVKSCGCSCLSFGSAYVCFAYNWDLCTIPARLVSMAVYTALCLLTCLDLLSLKNVGPCLSQQPNSNQRPVHVSFCDQIVQMYVYGALLYVVWWDIAL